MLSYRVRLVRHMSSNTSALPQADGGTPDIALITCAQYLQLPAADDVYVNQIHTEDRLLADGLSQHGLTSARIDWADPTFDWASVRCAVIRTTWDYFQRFAEFSNWLEQVALKTNVLNDIATLRWNIDKHYLADLGAKGVEIVPTVFVERGASADVAAIACDRKWDGVVIKPAVSGGAYRTYRASGHEIGALQQTFEECLREAAMLIQPFMPEIVAEGEISLMVMDGHYTHAVRKTAKAGDFRVQDDHGGVAHAHAATAAERAFAERAIAACDRTPAYARVDIVNTAHGCRLMELELIEPELFLRFHPPSAKAMADAIAARL